jgi:peptidoglycan/xylan/chitin deacetylase (PgdA/CDA1 family)
MKKYFSLALFLFSLSVSAQFNQPWRGKKCAVALTYDDALDVHLDNAVPLLDSLGLKATFYLTVYSPAFRNRIAEWKRVAANGNELGNHTLFHPCLGNLPGRGWVKEYDMNKYTVQRMVDEVRMTNSVLQAVDGKPRRTFAYPCADAMIHDTSYIEGLRNDVAAARSVRNEMHAIGQVDLYNMDCYMVNGESGQQLIEWVKKAMQTQSLLVILFHGVGGGHDLNVSLPAHRELLQFLKQNEKDIWIAPLIEVADHIRDWQSRDDINKRTNEDHQAMLRQLNINSLRPGVNGNDPKAPNAANYDEAKANPFLTLSGAPTGLSL